MDNVEELYNKLYSNSFCVNARSIPLYLIFGKNIVNHYLENTNYTIYVSTTNNSLSFYQSAWPSHARLQYITDNFIPTSLPPNTKCIYIYHQKYKPTIEEQLSLINLMKNNPLLKYVYVGMVHRLIPLLRITLFKYYLHFEITKSVWGGRLQSGNILDFRTSRKLARKYHIQNLQKKKSIKMTLYDYFVCHDLSLDVANIYRFNKRQYKLKVKKTQTNVQAQPINGIQNKPKKEKVQIKYIYTNTNNSIPNFLVMPDGTKENYQNISQKYKDVIEI